MSNTELPNQANGTSASIPKPTEIKPESSDTAPTQPVSQPSNIPSGPNGASSIPISNIPSVS